MSTSKVIPPGFRWIRLCVAVESDMIVGGQNECDKLGLQITASEFSFWRLSVSYIQRYIISMVLYNSSAVFPSFSQVAAHLRDWSGVYVSTLCEPENDADENATKEKHAAPIHRSGVDR